MIRILLLGIVIDRRNKISGKLKSREGKTPAVYKSGYDGHEGSSSIRYL